MLFRSKSATEGLVVATHETWAHKLGKTTEWLDGWIKQQEDMFSGEQKDALIQRMREATRNAITKSWDKTMVLTEKLFVGEGDGNGLIGQVADAIANKGTEIYTVKDLGPADNVEERTTSEHSDQAETASP